MLRRHHCELAFEAHLRRLRLPYVAVDEAKRSLLPDGPDEAIGADPGAIKSFDFLVSTPERNLLVDIKGRKLRWTARSGIGRLENWVTREDLRSLERWESLFGDGFEAVFVFAYWTDRQPPDGEFDHLLRHRDRWYALRCVTRADYAAIARTRSPKWETLDLSPDGFARVACGLTGARRSRAADRPRPDFGRRLWASERRGTVMA